MNENITYLKLEEKREHSPVKGFMDKKNDRKDLDEMLRNRKESESFDIKCLAFVLIDLIPYEKKEEMISAFEKLFSLPSTGTRLDSIRDQIHDITEGGSIGFKARLGNIHNVNKLHPDRNQPIVSGGNYIFDMGGVKAELPDAIDRIEIWIGQEVDFCYYAYYFCYVSKKYQNVRRETYIHSGDLISFKFKWGYGERPQGPKFDPTLPNYENDVGQFLSKYMNGLFLNVTFTKQTAVPSLRILSTHSIDPDLTAWGEKYWLFLEYMRINRFFHAYHRSIISLQTDKIFQKSFMPKGITILYSEEILPNDKTKDYDIFDRILGDASVTIDALIDYFVPLYWVNYNIFSPLNTWKLKLKNMQSGIKSKSLTLEELEEKVTEINDIYGEFSVFNNDERINIRTARKTFNRNKRLKGPPGFTVFLYDLKLFKDISYAIEESFKDEELLIDDIQNQIDSLTSYYGDKSNLKLSFSNMALQKSNQLVQKRVSRLTLTIAVVGVIISIISLVVSTVLN